MTGLADQPPHHVEWTRDGGSRRSEGDRMSNSAGVQLSLLLGGATEPVLHRQGWRRQDFTRLCGGDCSCGRGRSVFLVSTDPASNLDEMLQVSLDDGPRAVPKVPNLVAMNIDPRQPRWLIGSVCLSRCRENERGRSGGGTRATVGCLHYGDRRLRPVCSVSWRAMPSG